MRLLGCYMVLWLATPFGVAGQDYFFRQYAQEEGLHHSFVNAVNQDTDGYLWIGTGEGLYRFNGFEFEDFSAEEGLDDNFITNIYRDGRGNLWIGHQNGAISTRSGNDFQVIRGNSDVQGSVTDISEDDRGIIWATILNQGLISIRQEQVRKPVGFPRDEPLSQIEYLGDNHFLIGSQESLYLSVYQEDSDTMIVQDQIAAYPGSRVVSIVTVSPGEYVIVSRDNGIHLFTFDTRTVEHSLRTIDDNMDGELDNLQGAIFDNERILWLHSLGNGLFRYRKSGDGRFARSGKINTGNGLVSDNVRSLFRDAEGNLWLGMFGEGLLRYVDNNLRFYRYQAETGSDKTYAVTGDKGGLYTVAGNHLLRLDQSGDNVIISVPFPQHLAGDVVNAAYLTDDGKLWLGFEKSGLHIFSPSGFLPVFLSRDDLANSVNHISGGDSCIWVGTKKGIARFSMETGDIDWFTTEQGLPHNNIRQSFIDSKGRVLVATFCREIHYIDEDGSISVLENSAMGIVNELISLAEDEAGNIWAATQGSGVWKMGADGNVNLSRTSGLISDYCYSMNQTDDGGLVVGHRGGISRIDPKSNRIRTMGRLDGISSSAELYQNAVYKDPTGAIWFGTSEGLLKFLPRQSEGALQAPRLKITALYVDGRPVNLSAGRVGLKAGFYELAVEYIGIHLTHPEAVTYQTMLEGYNRGWSDITSARRVVYDRVGHGQYNFKIKAFNENGIPFELSAGFTLYIKKPVYLTSWFYLGSFVVLSIIIILIIRLRERNQRRFQQSLKEQLDERTREVTIQKEEIEIKNKDITDSITYAQKIQSSILPPANKLKERFAGGFVFYQPKDIVSGDFYWYGEFDNEIFVVACADATGHGVPGAFMSMIGTTLLKDISRVRAVNTPSKLLSRLDQEVRTVLSQNLENGGSNDGMDIIVAEINIKSQVLNVASAMRPMVIYQDGAPIYFSGNRFSIGGQYDLDKKRFDTKKYQLNKGDKIYLYTDGYSDQFGGPEGRKFKTGNVKKLLEEVHQKPMDEQHAIIRDKFLVWKGDHEQVDDVLFMGIEL
jgi:ligand-binding sensor domain-containing protein/serine phosphatase RsbU (regulator of sigma subunit)